tara:strand:+ start:95310 stop:95930 length:621 start_codon:yes stop_codon:yes gene_type:complete
MFREVYEKLEKKNKQEILDIIADAIKPTVLDGDNSSVIRCPIDFYPEHFLYEVADNNVMPPARRFFVIDRDKETMMPLEYSSESIYALNNQLGIQITKDNIVDYIKFFFNFARGRHGRFLALESVDDIQWQEEPPLAARRAIASMITPIEVLRVDSKGGFECAACFVFKDSLIRADLKISINGKVDLSGEEILVEDMPIMDDSFGQ